MKVNGTDYPDGTCFALYDTLEEARITKARIRIFLGSPETGECWNEENDVSGYVGRSMGPQKVPLLLATRHSTGGPAILVGSILAVLAKEEGEPRWQYKHPKFKVPEFRYVQKNGSCQVQLKKDEEFIEWALFHTEDKVKRYIDFMTGKRMTK